jgi:hypothetical protein
MPDPAVPLRDARNQPEAALLLACSRTRITPEIADRIRMLVQKEVDWLALIRLAMRHNVMPLLYRSLQQVCPDSVPANIFAPLRANYEMQAALARRRAEEVVRILPLFEDRGIPIVPYKGPALAQRLFGDASLREFSDLDFLILERDVSTAKELIRSLGYEYTLYKDTDDLAEYIRTNPDCELQFKRPDGAILELHWRFSRRSAGVRRDPERFWQRTEIIQLAGAQVPSLSLEVYFLILSMHAAKHKWGQLKLICDLAEILAHPGLDWTYVVREATDLGLRRMLSVSALLAEDVLDVEIPAELAQGLRIDSIARGVAGQISRGLFAERDKAWNAPADFFFQFKIRERLRDRTGVLCQSAPEEAKLFCRRLPDKLTPNERDRQFLPMPESFSSLYYLVKPVRWTWEKVSSR